MVNKNEGRGIDYQIEKYAIDYFETSTLDMQSKSLEIWKKMDQEDSRLIDSATLNIVTQLENTVNKGGEKVKKFAVNLLNENLSPKVNSKDIKS